MNTSNKLCLQWDSFQENLRSSVTQYREDVDFADVTIACEDVQIEAHKIIIASASPFFRSILKKNKHSHPLIFLRGIKSKYLQYIVDYIYKGQVEIFESDLNEFLVIADEMELMGLAKLSSEEELKNNQQCIVDT